MLEDFNKLDIQDNWKGHECTWFCNGNIVAGKDVSNLLTLIDLIWRAQTLVQVHQLERFLTVQSWQLVHYEQYINTDVEVELHDSRKFIGKLRPYEQPNTLLVGNNIIPINEIYTIHPLLLTEA